MDDDERELMRRSVRHALHGGSHSLANELAHLGWNDLLEVDPGLAVPVLFEEQGRENVTSPMLDAVVLSSLADHIGEVDGSCAVLYPMPADGAQPTSGLDPTSGSEHTTQRAELVVSGIGLTSLDSVAVVMVPTGVAGGVAAAVVPTRLLQSEPIRGIDPNAGWVAVTGRVPLERVVMRSLPGGAWGAATASARRALAHELSGVAERMLELAVEHVSSRYQFGRPIGSFQAVKHRLADVFVARSAAQAAIDHAWAAQTELGAAMAKSLAAAAHAEAARQCQQTMGGIGFTWEHPLHRYIRRGYLLDSLLGSARMLQRELGARLVVDGLVPRLPVFSA
jgi:alkylation response protein AidB-like acyl-CoA dehydrogenase